MERLSRAQGHADRMDLRTAGMGIRSVGNGALATGLASLHGDEGQAPSAPADALADVRSIHSYFDTVNEIERRHIAWEFAPECTDCDRGSLPDGDICQRCGGEGRILEC